MQITVSCAGRFHAYDMAAQFQKMGILNRLITSYPKNYVSNFGIDKSKITSLVYWELVHRGLSRWSQLSGRSSCWYQPFLNELFDSGASQNITEDSNVYIGWSSKSEKGLKKAKSLGATTILERGSSHIIVQTELLDEEFRRYSRDRHKCFTHPSVIEKEIREYDIADYISVPSEFAKQSFIAQGFPEAKIIKNPYGVNLAQFKPGPKADDVFRVIYVGQMSLRKGVHYLLEAFSRLKMHNSELLLIGSMTKEIEPYFNKYKPCITYLGVKSQHELVQYYQQSSVFAICSIEEGLAMVQAQAMASGLPLICTKNSGGEDLVESGKEGFVVPIRNVDVICEKIQWMHDHREEALSMGFLARQKVINGFTWDDYGLRYRDNLKNLGLH